MPSITHFLHLPKDIAGDSSPWVFDISVLLANRGTHKFCPRVPFQECLYSEQLWKIERVSLSRMEGKSVCFPVKILSTSRTNFGQVGLQSTIKDWGFLSLRLLSCDTHPPGAAPIWAWWKCKATTRPEGTRVGLLLSIPGDYQRTLVSIHMKWLVFTQTC